jgi:hypothetical protein
MTGSPTPPRVRPRDIADLLAWATSLSAPRRAADPAERAAYLAAKADLLTRIADQHTHDDPATPTGSRPTPRPPPSGRRHCCPPSPRRPRDRQTAGLLRIHPHALRP